MYREKEIIIIYNEINVKESQLFTYISNAINGRVIALK